MADGAIISGIKFERETARLLSALGWEVDFTSVSGYGGVDLVARLGAEVLVVQCKDWVGTVGIVDVQRTASACIGRGGNALVVARTGFAAGCFGQARLEDAPQ